jgi:multidrug resistance efflux pump
MNRTVKIVTPILISLIVMILLAACGGSANPDASKQGEAPDNTPPPSGISGLPSGIPQGADGAPSGSNSQNAVSSSQNAVFGKGTVTVDTYANLYFGSAGKVALINVKEGDGVTSGTILAKLDTANLEAALEQAEVALDLAKFNQIQANINVKAAEFNLDKTKAVSDIRDEITNIQWQIKIAELRQQESLALSDRDVTSYWAEQNNTYQKDLANQNKKLTDLLDNDEYTGSGALTYDIMGQKYDRLTVEDAQAKNLALELAQQSVSQCQHAMDLAQTNLDIAQKQLNEAAITAPFDGIIAKIYPRVGDNLTAPAQAINPVIYMIDPGTMQLQINVNELDMPAVKMNQKASVSINAFTDVKIDGVVTAISTVASTTTGGIYYSVTVSFTPPPNINIGIDMNGSAALNVQ